MIAEVVFNLPLERGFDYLVPPQMQPVIQRGMRVVAPFGPRRLIGYVAQVRQRSAIQQPKTLLRLIDHVPVLTPERWRLAQWLADYYYCSLGETCASMVPTGLRLREPSGSRVADPDGSSQPAESPSPVELMPSQARAVSRVTAAITAGAHEAFLIHGITASGKTEVYLRLIGEVLQRGGSAICLVPEIALTPQTIDRFRQRFGAQVALWHSRLTARQRADAWQRLETAQSRIVVGTRSAVFAPVQRLGIIVVDEEHDASYKQDDTPRYHARDVALARARQARAVVVLGSATPSVESYYAAQHRHLHLLELPERVTGRQLPKVEVIDMRQELAARRRLAPLSARLQQALRQVVASGEQAILLLNRRGFARVVQCPGCGHVMRCVQCDVPLIYHASPQQLQCHYCNRRHDPPEMCPACRKVYLRFRGSGTERIESELHRLFAASSIARMDRDTTKPRESHRQLYEAIKTRHVDLLVGTQMVAKGFDLPQVTLVGVVSADTALNLPDFRAGERTFDLLTQVAGRAGRGERSGRVVIQTFCPTHYAIRAASRQDYREFYDAEIQMRRRLALPPVKHLVEVTILGHRRERVENAAQALKRTLQTPAARHRVALLGPAPHRLASIRRTVRWRLVLKASRVPTMVTILRQALGTGRRFQGLPVIVDVDPM